MGSPPSRVPRISVVMSVYNEERFLRGAIDCILGQTFDDLELIVVDDASSDGTAGILAQYAREDPRVQVLTNGENRGLTANLNVGLGLARGEFIARMDGDDLCRHDRLEKQLAAFEADPELVLCGTGAMVIDAEGKATRLDVQGTSDWEFHWLALVQCPIRHSSAMFRRSLLEAHHLSYDEAFKTSQEFDLWSRMIFYGRAVVLEETLVFVRTHANSVTSRQNDEQHRNAHVIATKSVERWFPQLAGAPELIAFFDLFYRRSSANAARLRQAANGLSALERAYCDWSGLSGWRRRRIHQYAGRWLVIAMLRSGGLRPLWQLPVFLLVTLRYWPAFFAGAWDYARRRRALRAL
jgi:glycosyltransferase involved in cell wall biosynthesis